MTERPNDRIDRALAEFQLVHGSRNLYSVRRLYQFLDLIDVPLSVTQQTLRSRVVDIPSLHYPRDLNRSS